MLDYHVLYLSSKILLFNSTDQSFGGQKYIVLKMLSDQELRKPFVYLKKSSLVIFNVLSIYVSLIT